ncbi:MAG: quinolinate synthase NadA [Cellulosilyticaceae bacterium]
MESNQLLKEINRLKKKKNAIILAHYYTDDLVQEVADYVGDSYYLSKIGKEAPQDIILFCGVKFMGESAKILSPDKQVIMADELADCPMAHMVDVEKIQEMRRQYKDLAVVCYINSTAEIKAASDVCVTSANAVDIVRGLDAKYVFFIPDEHLGRFVAKHVPEKHILFNEGFCHVHTSITAENVRRAKAVVPQAEVVVHPECTEDVIALGNYVGSTSGIIKYVTHSQEEAFIVCTELGILYELKRQNPNKKFYSVGHRQYCPNMKRINLEKIYKALTTLEPQIQMEEALRLKAKGALENMHVLAK